MPENYYNEIPLSDLQTLKKLKFAIENTYINSDNYNDLLNNYHEEVYDLLPFLDNPLAPEYELEESLLPEGYLEFKRSCLSSPPYTFVYHCQKRDAVALVEIVSIDFKKMKIRGKLLKLFKGNSNWFDRDWCGNICFKISSGWFQAHFKVNEKALILLDKINNSLVIPGRNDKLTINYNEEIAMSSYRDREGYWNGFSSWNKDNMLAINWKELHHFLTDLQNN